jgi:DNA-binding IclR family transcriptional regulator
MPEVVHPTSLRGSARLVLHLAGQPTGNTGKLLAERSGFSYSGAAKHMMLLRRRGLVVRRGWRHYTLSQKALDHLSAAAQAQPHGAKF